MTQRRGRVVLVKGKVRWYFNWEASNGRIVATSQKYFSRSNAKRAALRAANGTNSRFIE